MNTKQEANMAELLHQVTSRFERGRYYQFPANQKYMRRCQHPHVGSVSCLNHTEEKKAKLYVRIEVVMDSGRKDCQHNLKKVFIKHFSEKLKYV